MSNAGFLEIKVFGSNQSLVTTGLRVPQVSDAQSASAIDLSVDGRNLGAPWDYDSVTDRVELIASNGDSVALTRVGDYWRWTVQPGDLRGPTVAPGSTLALTCEVVVTRTVAGDTVVNAPTRWASRPFTVTLERKAGFSPDSIGGLALWLDSYAVTESAGATVQTWDDKGVFDRDAAQSTSGLRPTRRTDGTGRPYLEFDGVDDAMATAWAQFGAPCTLFVAGRIASRDGTVRGAVQVGGSNGPRLAFDNANLKGVSGSDVANTSLPAIDTTFVGTVTKLAGGAVTVRNGLGTTVTEASTAVVAAGTVQLGDTAADAAAAIGLFEVIVYDSVLSDENRARVVRYLQSKWGA